MKKKQVKPQIIPPFQNASSNWEMITKIQSSLNKYLQAPHMITNIEPSSAQERLSRSNIDFLTKSCKSLLQIVDVCRQELKVSENVKQNAMVVQQKLDQHESIVGNLEKNFAERTKSLIEENKILKQNLERMKKMLNESEKTNNEALQTLKNKNAELQNRIQSLETENQKLLMNINDLQEELRSKCYIISKYQNSYDFEQKIKDNQLKMKEYKDKKFEESAESSFNRVLFDVNAISTLLSYLNPKEICLMLRLNKSARLIILKSKYCVFALCKSIVAIKNRIIAYYHNHITYFQNLYHKIPEQIIQKTYFQSHIAKQSIGLEILSILNSSALIFEGKFVQDNEGQELYTGIKKQNENGINLLQIKSQQIAYLEVDDDIITEYYDQKKQEKQKLIKEVELMYKKINNTLQLYSVDVETSKLFMKNVLKNFSKVFVLSKNLYAQARNLQQLNIFLLSQLSTWDKMEIDKANKLEDLRAELEAERKLKLFFTDKSTKSQQKALMEENLKLNYEMKYSKLVQMMNSTCSEKDELQKKCEDLFKINKSLTHDLKQIKRSYENGKEKYNKIIEELTVVKQTIVRMNII